MNGPTALAAVCALAAAWVFLLSLANSLWLASTNRVHPLRSGPKISVLVPARNEAARIEKCLASLLAQDYADYELIVYDDDSSDDTGSILDRLAAGQETLTGQETLAGQEAAGREALVGDKDEAAHETPAAPESSGGQEIAAARVTGTAGKADLAQKSGAPQPRLRVIHGKGLPEGWYGKAWAMHNLAKAATGDYLLFTDADTVHSPRSLGRLAALARRYQADLVSGYVQHEIPDFGQAAVVPSIYLLTMAIMPLALIPRVKSPAISHAIGQCMFFEAETYRRIGGYEAVRDRISEDVRIARLAKRGGARLVFADLKREISCSMYATYREAVDGIAKNVFDYLDKKPFLLALVTCAVPLVCYLPLIASVWLPPALRAAGAPTAPSGAPLDTAGALVAQAWFRIASGLFFAAWIPVSIERRLPWYQAAISPIVLASTLSAGWRARSRFRKGESLLWKGRKVS